MSVAIGVDIGGTKVLAAVVDEAGRVLDTETAATPDLETATVDLVQEILVDVVTRLTERHGRATVGVGAAGFVDAPGERIRFAPHLPWRDVPLAADLTRSLAGHVVGKVLVDNDANAALWAEARFGAAQHAHHALMVTLGTGIGGGLLVGGRLHRGLNGMAGEFGHMQMVPDGRGCECGKRGCWEQYCSGRALARYAADLGVSATGSGITAAAHDGDGPALAAYAETGRWLGVGVANLVAAFDPEIVVVGGGLSAAGDLLLEPARAALAEHLVGSGYREQPALVGAVLGPLAGVIGVADLVRSGRARRFSLVGRSGRAPLRAARGTARRR